MKDAVRYTVIDNDLLVVDAETGDVRWHGRPGDASVVEVLPLDNTSDAVVLLDYGSKRGSVQNLVRIRSDGSIHWHAQLPTAEATDAYVSVELKENCLIGHTWSGHRVTLDVEAGKILRAEFVK